MPFTIGISASNNKMPTKPIIVPITILFHTRQKHIPTPKVNAPIMPNTESAITLPFSFIGALFSIFLHIMRVIKPKIMPTVPKTIPGLSEFHSGSSAMHIPSANITPDIVVRNTFDFEKSLILGAFQGFWLIPTRLRES